MEGPRGHRRSPSSRSMAQLYGVSPKTIRDIWNRRTWSHTTVPAAAAAAASASASSAAAVAAAPAPSTPATNAEGDSDDDNDHVTRSSAPEFAPATPESVVDVSHQNRISMAIRKVAASDRAVVADIIPDKCEAREAAAEQATVMSGYEAEASAGASAGAKGPVRREGWLWTAADQAVASLNCGVGASNSSVRGDSGGSSGEEDDAEASVGGGVWTAGKTVDAQTDASRVEQAEDGQRAREKGQVSGWRQGSVGAVWPSTAELGIHLPGRRDEGASGGSGAWTAGGDGQWLPEVTRPPRWWPETAQPPTRSPPRPRRKLPRLPNVLLPPHSVETATRGGCGPLGAEHGMLDRSGLGDSFGGGNRLGVPFGGGCASAGSPYPLHFSLRRPMTPQSSPPLSSLPPPPPQPPRAAAAKTSATFPIAANRNNLDEAEGWDPWDFPISCPKAGSDPPWADSASAISYATSGYDGSILGGETNSGGGYTSGAPLPRGGGGDIYPAHRYVYSGGGRLEVEILRATEAEAEAAVDTQRKVDTAGQSQDLRQAARVSAHRRADENSAGIAATMGAGDSGCEGRWGIFPTSRPRARPQHHQLPLEVGGAESGGGDGGGGGGGPQPPSHGSAIRLNGFGDGNDGRWGSTRSARPGLPGGGGGAALNYAGLRSEGGGGTSHIAVHGGGGGGPYGGGGEGQGGSGSFGPALLNWHQGTPDGAASVACDAGGYGAATRLRASELPATGAGRGRMGVNAHGWRERTAAYGSGGDGGGWVDDVQADWHSEDW